MSDNRGQDVDEELISGLKKGDREAVNEIISQYFDRVLRAAEKRIRSRNVGVSAPDDIAVSVFESLWRRSEEKRFSDDDLENPEELWRLLSKMIQFKANDHAKRNLAQKRGGGQVRGESVFENPNQSNIGIAGQAFDGFSPEQIIEMNEGYTELMVQLEDETLQKIAVMRLENFQVSEIAEEFGKSERWVKRKLAIIRETWIAAGAIS